MGSTDNQPIGLADVAQRAVDAGEGEYVSIADMVSAFGTRAFSPLLLVLALVALTPIGAIPGASVVIGSAIILLALQMLIGRHSPWLPALLGDIRVERQRAGSSVKKIKPYLTKVDKVIHPRWRFLFESPVIQIVAILCILLAASMYPLALVPWGVLLPVSAIAVLSLGLASQDGIVLSAGLVAAACALGVGWYFFV